jgi:hypothetical protein
MQLLIAVGTMDQWESQTARHTSVEHDVQLASFQPDSGA